MGKPNINVFWFRRDLRLTDNHGLFKALTSGKPVLPVFVFDTQILDKLERPLDLRVQFIHETLSEIHRFLSEIGTGLTIFFGKPVDFFTQLCTEYNIDCVFTNHDYEPYAIERDTKIADLLQTNGIQFQSTKDHVYFEKREVVKDDGNPYTVFTPYSKKWKIRMAGESPQFYPAEKHFSNFLRYQANPLPSLQSMGFEASSFTFPSITVNHKLIDTYTEKRNFPGIQGTSHLGIHLRFGTISIRQLVATARMLNETFLNELIWRDFYHMILFNFPHIGRGEAFRREYDNIKWLNNEEEFKKWCSGETGYPIVDAGMRELSATGFMHNRVRMITASFLSKHLLIDWRWGEAWFASKLLDFDLAANNGGWQWAAGSGCDAAPYFRVFNPTLQAQKFDPQGNYIKKWVPELDGLAYSQPIVNHEFARKRCLARYSEFLKRD
jgi:deoxyribodipyrimidine photo-lyase